MTKIIRLALALFCCAMLHSAFGQSVSQGCTHPVFAFLNNQIVGDEDNPQSQWGIATNATGRLTVCPADLSPAASVANKLPFQVAIRDQRTQDLVMYSQEDFRQVDIQQVLAKCRKGDRIVLLPLDDLYTMPHNEIPVL